MARCQWCGTVSRRVERLPNGRSDLLLCPLCRAQREVLEEPTLRPADLPPRPPLEQAWERLRRLFGLS